MKKELTLEQQIKKYKRRFYRTLCILLILVVMVVGYIYSNYDYLAFKHFITGHYIYTDALNDIFKDELKMDVKGKYYAYFDDLVISTVTRRIREENNDKYTYLYTPERFASYKTKERHEAAQSEIKVLNDTTLYLRLTNFSTYTFSFVKNHLDELKKAPNIILDLRDNGGGDVDAMANICDFFLPKGTLIATNDLRMMDWRYKAKKKQALQYENILILQNGNTASASENMIAALNDNLAHVKLIGEKTFGKGIGQYTLPLKRGFAVKATILLWNTPAGVNIHQSGIDAEIPYSGEDLLDFARSQLDR